MTHDLRFSARTLSKTPAFTLVAVLTLALGIGLTSSIFSIFEAVLVDGLPFEDSERLVHLSGTLSPGSESSDVPFSFDEIQDFRASTDGLEGLAGYSKPTPFNLALEGSAENVDVELVTDDYFSVLGGEPILGRLFSEAEQAVGAGDRVVILGHSLWIRRFAGSDAILRGTLQLGGESYEVIGVMGPEFRGLGGDAMAWLPASRAATILAPKYVESRAFGWLGAVARLDEGRTLDQVRSRVDAVVDGLAEAHPDIYRDFGVRLAPLAEERLGNLQRPLTLLLGASFFVLLIVCTNVANLLLARIVARQQELSLRTAFGASRWQLVRLLLAESLLLSLVGGALGFALAYLATDLLLQLGSARLPSYIDVEVDGSVAAMAFAIALACSVVLGLLGVLRTSRIEITSALQESGRSISLGRGHARLQGTLVVTQVALTLVLLISTGALYQGFRDLRDTELGFEPRQVLSARLYLMEPRFDEDAAVWSFARQVLGKLGSLPGVESVALASPTVPTDNYTAYYGVIEDVPESLTDRPAIMLPHFVSPEYFSTLEIPLVEGRAFTDDDTDTSEGAIIISESMAAHYWPGESPIGRRIKVRRRGHENRPWLHVVGVAKDLRHQGLSAMVRPGHDVYVPIFRVLSRDPPKINILAKTEGELSLESLASAIRGELEAIDPGIPPYDFASLEQRVANQVASSRLEIVLFGLLAMVALFLAAVGLYGLMSYSVSQRASELAICMALGADRREIARSVLRRGARLTFAGIAIGLAAGVVLVPRLLDSLVYEIDADVPLISMAASSVLVVIGLLACFVPAWRATRVAPASILRGDE